MRVVNYVSNFKWKSHYNSIYQLVFKTETSISYLATLNLSVVSLYNSEIKNNLWQKFKGGFSLSGIAAYTFSFKV
jgi:hypothetical protein